MAKPQQIKAAWKGKEWYELVAPKLFDEKVITETPASDVLHLNGRTTTISAAALTGNPSKYYYKIKFRVADVSGRRAKCEYAGHECSRDFISRMVRRRSKRVDTRDTITLKDGKRLIVKTISTTIRSTTSSIQSAIARDISSRLAQIASEMDIDSFVRDMLSGAIQKTLRKDISKTYPLRELEIRKTDVL